MYVETLHRNVSGATVRGGNGSAGIVRDYTIRVGNMVSGTETLRCNVSTKFRIPENSIFQKYQTPDNHSVRIRVFTGKPFSAPYKGMTGYVI